MATHTETAICAHSSLSQKADMTVWCVVSYSSKVDLYKRIMTVVGVEGVTVIILPAINEFWSQFTNNNWLILKVK